MTDLLTVEEVADLLSCKPEFVRMELRRKNLRGSRIGGTKLGWRIQRADLQAYIEAHANVTPVRKASA